MRRATMVGWFGTCGALALVAARAPERVSALVLVAPLAQGAEADDLHGWTDDQLHKGIETARHMMTNWGSGGLIDLFDPVLDTAYNRRLMAVLERCSATPAAAQSYFDWVLRLDIQDVFRAIHAPTRVVGSPDFFVPEAATRYVAQLISGSTFHLIPPIQPGSSLGQMAAPVADHIEEVATGTSHSSDADRFLGTVLFTDVVSSTELLARVGDTTYRQMRANHERLVRLAVKTNGGRLMTVAGDGTLSVFNGPSAAVRCAETICREAKDAGIAVRAGIHTGELERDAMNVTGLTVHIGARVGAAADPGQVLVSRTVHDLVAGSGLTFASKREHELKDIPGSWVAVRSDPRGRAA
ncbi:MAG: adenylate/guanylate cyclase domain-containing protein [Aeromicrobium sp.]